MINKYMCEIDRALQSKECIVFSNTDREHAKDLVMKLLRSAQHEVIIFCHRLARDVYGSVEVCEALDEAYRNNPDLKLKVYIRDIAPDYSPFVNSLLNKGVRIRRNIRSQEGDILLVDGMNGREETSETTRKAKAHINDRGWAEKAKQKLEALAPAVA